MDVSRDLVDALHGFWDSAAMGEPVNADHVLPIEKFILRLYEALDWAEEEEAGTRKAPDA